MNSVWAVVVAAGQGERLGLDCPKAFAPLRGRPLLAESLLRLDGCDLLASIVIVVPAGWEETASGLADQLGARKVTACVRGGTSRTGSVRAGVAEVPEEASAIVVHDAARPLVSNEVLARVLAPLEEGWDGAVPGLAVPDTLKRTAGGRVVETVDRAGLYAVQTPQAFRAAPFRRALAAPLEEASDCAGLVEAAGGRVRVVPGDPQLVKVTTTGDLAAVERLLAAR